MHRPMLKRRYPALVAHPPDSFDYVILHAGSRINLGFDWFDWTSQAWIKRPGIHTIGV